MPYQYAIVAPDYSTTTRCDRQLGTWMDSERLDIERWLEWHRRDHPEARPVRRMIGEWEEVAVDDA